MQHSLSLHALCPWRGPFQNGSDNGSVLLNFACNYRVFGISAMETNANAVNECTTNIGPHVRMRSIIPRFLSAA